MAQGDGTIILDVGGNTRQLEKDIARVANQSINLNLKGFGQPLGKISGQLGEFEKSLAASNARVIAFGASAGAIFAIERALAETVRTAIKVEKALADINVILNTSSGSLKNFGAELFNIAKSTGQSFDAVAAAATELSRQGLGIEQTLKRTSDALVLARLSGLDTVSTVEALTAAINSFSKSALDSTTIINKLAAVDAAFAVSSADLAEAIKRVGSSAEDAGVSFDQLISIVTSAQQITSRGGAVIGNSLKTIFTRLQRTDTLDALEQIGVATRDAQGEILPLINILSSLASTYDKLNSTQRASIAETVGGVFQINILKAALSDLSSEYSIFSRALETSVGATDEAIARNEQLNQTLSALINKTLQNLTQVGAGIGEDVFGPALKKVLNGLNAALESFGDADSTDVGSKIGKGLMKGLGDFLAGPGLAIGGLALFKIFERLTVFTADAFKSLTGLNSKAAEQKVLQSQIFSILAKNPEIIKQINTGQVSLVDVHRTLLGLIQQETAALNQQAAIAATLSKTLYGSGVRVSRKGETKGLPVTTRSEGYIPNYSLTEELEGIKRSRDYSGTEKNKARPFLTNLNGEMVYVNDQEIKVPAGDIYKKMGLPDETRPKNPGEKYGILNPKQQKLLGFNGGFIPNFKNPKKLSADQLVNQIDTLSSVKNIPINKFDPNNSKMRLDALKNSIQGLRELKTALAISEEFSGKQFVQDKLEEEFSDLKDRYDKQKERYRKSLYEYKDIFSAVRAEMDMKEEYSKGFIPSFQKDTQPPVNINLNELDPTVSSKYAVLIAKGGGDNKLPYSQGAADIPSLRGVLPRGSGVSVSLRQRSAFPLKQGNIKEAENEFDDLLEANIGAGLTEFARNIGRNLLGKDVAIAPFVNKLGGDVKGSLFEKSVRAAIYKESDIDRIPSNDPNAPFDFDPASAFLGFEDLFGLKNIKAVEAKISQQAALDGRLPSKVLAKEPSLLKKILEKYGKKVPTKFRGFIPSFEDDMDEARKEALEREQSATKLPKSQIKLVRDRRLKNRLNPYGEAVINKRDEPSGTAAEGIKRFKSLSDARMAGMPDMRWTGHIPNFALGKAGGRFQRLDLDIDTKTTQSSLEKFQQNALLASFAFSTLGGVVEQFTGEFNPKAKNYINSITSGASAFATLAGIIPGKAGLIIGAIAGIGIAANGIIKTLKSKAPELEAALENVKEENQKFADSTSRYLETYNKLNDAIANTEGNQDQITQNIIKLNKELAEIAFELPEKYRAEILAIQDSTELQNKIAQIRQQQLEKEKALLAATGLQKKIDESQGLGRMLFGMGRNVLNKPGETRRLGADVTGDIGRDNLLKLAASGDLVSKSQQDLINTMMESYEMSEELGGALSQLSESDFAGLRAVLISSANDIKNLTELNEELSRVRKEEQDKIRALNKAIAQSKAKIADLSKTILDDLVRNRARAQNQRENRREILQKDFESRIDINKQFQGAEDQAQGEYLKEMVKIEKERINSTEQALEEGNKALTDRLQELMNTNREQGGTQISPEAQIAVIEKLRKDFNEKTVTPDVLGREIEEILKSQNINKDELEKLRKDNEKGTRETNAKLDKIADEAKKQTELNKLALKYAQQQAQIQKDLKAVGGYESFTNPEKDKDLMERYMKAYEYFEKFLENPEAPEGRQFPIKYGQTVADKAEIDKEYFGIEATRGETRVISEAMAQQQTQKYEAAATFKRTRIEAIDTNMQTLQDERKTRYAQAGIGGEGLAQLNEANEGIQQAFVKDAEIERERRAKKYELQDIQAKDTRDMSDEEKKKLSDREEVLKKELGELDKAQQASQDLIESRRKERDEIYKSLNINGENLDAIKKNDQALESIIQERETEVTKLAEIEKQKMDPEERKRASERIVREKLKTEPLNNDEYDKGVQKIVDAIKDPDKDKDNLASTVDKAIREAAAAASQANVDAIKAAFAELKEQEKAAEQAKKDAEERTKQVQKEIEAKQAAEKTAASKEALKASGQSLLKAKADEKFTLSLLGLAPQPLGGIPRVVTAQREGAQAKSKSEEIPSIIEKAVQENANINSTSDLITQLRTDKELGAKITAGTSFSGKDLLTELEDAYAKKGKEQREGAFVGGLDTYIQNLKNQQKLQAEAQAMQPQPVMPTQIVDNTMIGMPTQPAPYTLPPVFPQPVPPVPSTTIDMGAPVNTIEDFLRNPPAEQPAGPLTPQATQPPRKRNVITAYGSMSGAEITLDADTGERLKYDRETDSYVPDGPLTPQATQPPRKRNVITAYGSMSGAEMTLDADTGERLKYDRETDSYVPDGNREEQSRRNEAGGKYLDKKYGLGDASEETKQNQMQGTAKLTENKRETSRQKQEELKAQADMKASLENLSAQINANTEAQKEAKEQKEESDAKIESEGSIEIPKLEIPPVDININVQGSIDQIPSETSTKTVQAIKDVVNQILPGEISKRLGALKA
jgi:TP901 family phage tail tape measure protein